MKRTFNRTSGAHKKNNTGRPKSSPDQKRSRKLSSAYTEAEYSQIQNKAAAAQKAPSVYQREATLNGTVNVQPLNTGIAIGILQELYKEARYCRAELHKAERTLSSASLSKRQHQNILNTIENINALIYSITMTLRKEAGLDPAPDHRP